MPRRLRKDYPGAWHHVMDRGIAKRTLFETHRDVRLFLSCLAWQVRAGDLEIHVFAVLTTHFHLLVRSPRGRLSVAMQRALDAYARWFNRSRRRDGPLFRGRYVNRIVEDEGYLRAVVRYIDRNAVEAGLASRAEDYPHGSARHYVSEEGPRWLTRDVLLGWARTAFEGVSTATAYGLLFSDEFDMERNKWIVERGLREGPRLGADLLLLASPRERLWMSGKLALAEGARRHSVPSHPDTVLEVVRRAKARAPDMQLRLGRNATPWWDVAEVGALRSLSGLRLHEIADRLHAPATTIWRRQRTHEMAMRKCADYAKSLREIAHTALALDYAAVSS